MAKIVEDTKDPRADYEERQKTLEKMTPAFREMYDTILGNYNDESTNIIRSRYEQGKNVIILSADDPDSVKKYGKRSIAKMAYCIGEDRSYLQNCKRFAELYDEPRVEFLINNTTVGGNLITWSHIVATFQIEDEDSRDEAIEHLLANDLSVLQFRKWIVETYGISSKANNPGGRNGKKDPRPQTFSGFIENISDGLDRFMKQADEVWLKDDDDDPRTMRALFKAATVDDKTLKSAKKAQEMCQQSASRILALERELGLFLAETEAAKPDPEDLRLGAGTDDSDDGATTEPEADEAPTPSPARKLGRPLTRTASSLPTRRSSARV